MQNCVPEADGGCGCEAGFAVLPDSTTCSEYHQFRCSTFAFCLGAQLPGATCFDTNDFHPSLDTYACLVLCDADGGCPDALTCRARYWPASFMDAGPPPPPPSVQSIDVCLRE